MAMTGYDLNRSVVDRVSEASTIEMLAAARRVAEYAEDIDDLHDLLWVLGISREILVLGMLDLEASLRL